MIPESVETLIIGAGLSGLSAGLRLHEAGREVLILEASDGVGGRVRTDRVDGFLLDRGFQVYLDAYPEAGSLLDLKALDLRPFEPGALVWRKGKLRRIMDVFRHPRELLSSAIQPIGGPLDKILVAKLRAALVNKPPGAIWSAPEMTTADYLRRFGFSESMIDLFFRGFYGGIFLEDHLVTSSRMFEFTFGLFARGSATLPAAGMQAIPDQLAARLPGGAIRLNEPVELIRGTTAVVRGREIKSANIIVATDGSTAAELVPGRASTRWNSTTCLYFSAPEPPVSGRLIALKGDREGLINHLCVPSQVAPSYSPPGRSLVSVSVIGNEHGAADLLELVTAELKDWFGEKADSWIHLKTCRINRALPIQPPGHHQTASGHGPLLLCGDHCTSGSIEGAIISGLRAATRLLEA